MIITPEARARAYKAAFEHAKIFGEFADVPLSRIEEISTDITAEALLALAEPINPHPEPTNHAFVTAKWPNGNMDTYVRDDDSAPTGEEILRPWYSHTYQVWLTWAMVLQKLEEKLGPDFTYSVYVPASVNGTSE